MDALSRLAILSFSGHVPQLKVDIFLEAAGDQKSWELLTQANLTNGCGMAVQQHILDCTEFKLALVVRYLEHFDLAVIKARCSNDKSDWKRLCFADLHCLADLCRCFELVERGGCHFDAAIELVGPRNDTWLLLAFLLYRVDCDLAPCLTREGEQAILCLQELHVYQG